MWQDVKILIKFECTFLSSDNKGNCNISYPRLKVIISMSKSLQNVSKKMPINVIEKSLKKREQL